MQRDINMKASGKTTLCTELELKRGQKTQVDSWARSLKVKSTARGDFDWADGSYYEGDFENGVFHGEESTTSLISKRLTTVSSLKASCKVKAKKSGPMVVSTSVVLLMERKMAKAL